MGSLRIALGKMYKAGEKDSPAGLAKGIAAIKNAKSAMPSLEGHRALRRPGRPGHGRRHP